LLFAFFRHLIPHDLERRGETLTYLHDDGDLRLVGRKGERRVNESALLVQ
jgi:hypothetical protein